MAALSGRRSGCSPDARRNFDPHSYRAVLFDHRGANTAPDLLLRIVYLSAYCCVASRPCSPTPLVSQRLTARSAGPDGLPSWVIPRTGVLRTNPRTGDPDVFAVQHALLMADLDPAPVPAVLAYATQPDEPLQVILANAQVDPET